MKDRQRRRATRQPVRVSAQGWRYVVHFFILSITTRHTQDHQNKGSLKGTKNEVLFFMLRTCNCTLKKKVINNPKPHLPTTLSL